MKIYFCLEGLRIIREMLQRELPDDEVLECAPARLAEVVGEADVLIPTCLLYTSPSPRDKRQSRMPSSA